MYLSTYYISLLMICSQLSHGYRPSMGSSATMSGSLHSMTSDNVPCVIVGAGLAGLATAAALRNIAKIDAIILERMNQEELNSDSAGAAIQLGPNGLRALHAIGGDDFIERICKEGTPLKGNAIILPNQTEPMLLPDSTEHETGLPQVLIRWAKLRQMLKELVPSESIQTDIDSIVGYEYDGNIDKACLVGPRKVISTSLIIGADGIYSTFSALVRQSDKEAPCRLLKKGHEDVIRRASIKDGGRTNLKAVVQAQLMPPDFAPQTTYSFFAGPVACFAGPAGDGQTYWAISVADDVAEDKSNFLSGIDVTDKKAVKAKLLEKLQSTNSPECQFAIDLIQQTDAQVIFRARSEERDIGNSLVSLDNAVVLVGDAAHAMSPSYGQSANFAFEDAVTLAMCLRDASDKASALRTFSQARLGRCKEMQQRSAERTAKASRGETADDISKWIFQWTIESLVGQNIA